MSDITVDVDKTREIYRAERDKRIRKDANDQYRYTTGELADLAKDPWAGDPEPRDPFTGEVEVLIIGAGFGGMLAAVELQKQGIEDFHIIDAAGDFGGTWYWNRYPGIRCDVESYVYMPLLEETGYMPTERYATGAEIFAYCQLIGEKFGLYPKASFQTRISGMTWNEATSRWTVTTDRQDRFEARFVITQSGIFSVPKLPGIEGIENFKGEKFHSARWNYEYTGGDSNGGLDKLGDKRVAIIGTGSTGLQIIPRVAKYAKHLTVFQRTPTQINVRENGPTDVEWFKSLKPGWQWKRAQNYDAVTQGRDYDECMVDDAWTRSTRYVGAAVAAIPEEERTPERIAAAMEEADFEWGEMNRQRVDEIVTDPRKAEILKAYYRMDCKRRGFSDEYLPAFNRPNVDLIDASTANIERITEHGIIVDGEELEFDCIIFATGFEMGTNWTHQAGYDVIGRGGQKLSDKWAKGMSTFHGLFTNGFPNIFFFGLTQTGATVSVPHMLQEQVWHISHVIRELEATGSDSFEATEDAEHEWSGVIRSANLARRQGQLDCTPGYFNNDGRPEDERGGINAGLYYPAQAFFDLLEDWRASSDHKGLVFS